MSVEGEIIPFINVELLCEHSNRTVSIFPSEFKKKILKTKLYKEFKQTLDNRNLFILEEFGLNTESVLFVEYDYFNNKNAELNFPSLLALFPEVDLMGEVQYLDVSSFEFGSYLIGQKGSMVVDNFIIEGSPVQDDAVSSDEASSSDKEEFLEGLSKLVSGFNKANTDNPIRNAEKIIELIKEERN